MSRTFPGHAWEEKCAKEKKMHLLQKNVKVLKNNFQTNDSVSQEFQIVININQFDLNSELCIKRPQTRMTESDWGDMEQPWRSGPVGALPIITVNTEGGTDPLSPRQE